jgi:hypothetical protein
LVILSGLLFLLLCASPLRRSPIPLRRIDFGFPVPAEKEQGKNPAQSLKSKAKRAIRTPKAKTVKLLSGGNPQFAKGGAPRNTLQSPRYQFGKNPLVNAAIMTRRQGTAALQVIRLIS